jgi:hypothetical protein
MESILRSTAALAATLALSAMAFMPSAVSAFEARSTGVGLNHSESFALETSGHDFEARSTGVGLNYSESFALETSGHELKNSIGCGPGSSSPFTPCEDVKRFCALMGGDYEPGSCTLPDWPPPPQTPND